MSTSDITVKKKRFFLPEDFKVTDWTALEPYFELLKTRAINNAKDLYQWFKDRSELESVLEEDMGWRYIKMTCDTTNKSLTDSFNYFVSEIQPKIAPYSNELNKKALDSPYLHQLNSTGFDIIIKLLEKDFKIYREQNIPIFTEIEQEAHQFGAISGAMTVEIDGKELTLPQASDILQSSDRTKRETTYFRINERRFLDKDKLNELYSKLIKLRHQAAINAGFENYRDYMFQAMGRFDYNVQDCFDFHQSIAKEVIPVINDLALERKKSLNLDHLRPWDLAVNYHGTEALKPFQNGEELLEKTIQCFHLINPYLGACLTTMKNLGHLDLVSRKGKAPGGYNYPLDETGVPFIFMNATTSLRDLVTMVHEGGHALHSFVTKDLEINTFKHPTSEVAELASMSMELISMEYWNIFFPNKADLKRAKREHLESILHTLPWVATIDKFQHWVYEHPQHTLEERASQWEKIFITYSNTSTNWQGIEKFRQIMWQKQLHLFEVPFYYIEYAIAQLGAIAVWKNYKKDSKKGFADYLAALQLGYSKPIKEIYKTAGIKFDFSQAYIHELIDFIKNELMKIEKE
ncbi:MAG: M3 family oligoendopeptidase [Cytophagales bacterium]|nr:MAG: M3 family oligoendopeptidase [Cytophagales bacterium]